MVEYEDVVAAAKSVPKVEPKSLIRTVDDLTVIDFFRKARDWAAQHTQETSEYGAIRESLEKIDESLGVMEDIKPEIRPFKLVRYKLHDSYIDCFWSFKDLLDSTEKSFKKPEDAYREYVDLLSKLQRPQPLQLVTSDWHNKVKRLCELLAILLEPLPLPIVCGVTIATYNNVRITGEVNGTERRGLLALLGDLIITAYQYEEMDTGLETCLLAAFTRDGELVWAKAPYIVAKDTIIGYAPADLTVVGNMIILAANAYAPGVGSQGIAVLAFDESGELLWARREVEHFCGELRMAAWGGEIFMAGKTGPDIGYVMGVNISGDLIFAKAVKYTYYGAIFKYPIQDIKADSEYLYMVGFSEARDPETGEWLPAIGLLMLDRTGSIVFNKIYVWTENGRVKSTYGRALALANSTMYIGAQEGIIAAFDLVSQTVTAAKRITDIEEMEDLFWNGDLWAVGYKEILEDNVLQYRVTYQVKVDPSLVSAAGKSVRGNGMGAGNFTAGRCIRVKDGLPYVNYQDDISALNDMIMFIPEEVVGTVEWEKGTQRPLVVNDYSVTLADVVLEELPGRYTVETPYYLWVEDTVTVADKTEKVKPYLDRALFYKK